MGKLVTIEGSFTGIFEDELEDAKTAIHRGLTEVSDWGKGELRSQVRRVGMGRKLPNTWRSAVYPNAPKTSLRAAAEIWSEAPEIIKSFSEGKAIQGKDGLFLAIPTDLAPKHGGDGKRISPSNFPTHRFGPLRFVYRKGQHPLLVVDGVRVKEIKKPGQKAKFKASRQIKNKGVLKSGKLGKGISTAVMFILVPHVSPRRRFDPDIVFRSLDGRLARSIVKKWNILDGRQ